MAFVTLTRDTFTSRVLAESHGSVSMSMCNVGWTAAKGMHGYAQVFRPYQSVRALVLSYPYVPDPLSLTAVLESQEEPITPSNSLPAASSSSPSDGFPELLQDYLQPVAEKLSSSLRQPDRDGARDVQIASEPDNFGWK